MFLPTTIKECRQRGWDQVDVILVSGDSYIDSPFIGVAVIGKTLEKAGFRVGIIAQPDVTAETDITRLGEPRLFWGVTGGAVDSMVANYTATRKRRQQDDYTPGGVNNRRPDRAVIAYANLIRRYFKSTVPIVLGGIEASLRRVAHYDFWSNTIRRSILFDAKADYLIYGMGEQSVVALAHALASPQSPRGTSLQGVCWVAGTPPAGYMALPPFETVQKDPQAFIQGFHDFYHNNDPATATGLYQKHADRYLIQNPPWPVPDTPEMDRIHDLEFQRDLHPFYQSQGHVRALDTIRFSLVTHRGCYGECNFCAIAVHEGRTVRWRSEAGIVKEVMAMTRHPAFKGIITDVGGPTANMYGIECPKKQDRGPCLERRCLFPAPCPVLCPDHGPQIRLLKRIRAVKGVQKVFVASGIRHDLVQADAKNGRAYLEQIVRHHVSGQMKLAPEHSVPEVLALMGKPGTDGLMDFKRQFEKISRKSGKKQFLTYYLMAAHPGCTREHMVHLKSFVKRELKLHPEQVQIFTPTPSTYATLMYATATNPFTGEKLFVEKTIPGKNRQKAVITARTPRHRGRKRVPAGPPGTVSGRAWKKK